MLFREKIHWVTLFTMIVAFGWYFINYPWQVVDMKAGVWATGAMLLVTAIGIIIVMTVATAFFAIRAPGEAHLKEDERDRVIHSRGTHLAYYPLVIGVWVNLGAAFYGLSQAGQINLLLATVVLAELVRIGSQIYLYRRGY
ncbi:MAG: hypothetical protein V3V15_06050 [Sphingorhabdus sp.]